jgi:hypothetical protein
MLGAAQPVCSVKEAYMSNGNPGRFTRSRKLAVTAFLVAALLPAAAVIGAKNDAPPQKDAVRQLVVTAYEKGLQADGKVDGNVLREINDGLHRIWRPQAMKSPLGGLRLAMAILNDAELEDGPARERIRQEFLRRAARDSWEKAVGKNGPEEGMQAIAAILENCEFPGEKLKREIESELINRLLRGSWTRYIKTAKAEDALLTALKVWESRPKFERHADNHLARDMFPAAVGKTTAAAIRQNRDFPASLALLAANMDLLPEDVDRNVAHDVVFKRSEDVQQVFQREMSWCRQDGIDFHKRGLKREQVVAVLEKVLEEARPSDAAALRAKVSALPENDKGAWASAYIAACESRCKQRLAGVVKDGPLRFVFTKHWNIGGQHFAYTENLSVPHGWRVWTPGGGLFAYTLNPDLTEKVELLLDAGADGCIRDPDVHWDAEKVLFAWKKSDRQDDYHLYEMDLLTRKVRQLTFGLGDADYEGVYLPDDNIMFTSTRCVQVIDCFTTDTSNMYICDRDGSYLRRVSFDQVTVNYPQVMNDGTVIYTRWEYNDRGQIYPQPLFQMNIDGTGQTEYYGNNSYFPNTIGHARPIPGSSKVIALASGHHSHQVGGLIRIDVREGRQEDEGCTYVAPLERKAPRFDAPPEHGGLYTHPYALNEKEYIAGYSTYMRPKYNSKTGFGIYYVREDGAREQLVYDPEISSSQPVLLRKRKRPIVQPSSVDYDRGFGTYYMQDVYHGPGMVGVKRGDAKKLRVVEVRFRASLIGGSNNRGPAGGAFVATPIGVANCAWDVKAILGETPIEADGSAFFKVPARRPVYFQVLDAKGRVIQTMRSWSTLMPGETFSCVGCHEDKNDAPLADEKTSIAMTRGVRDLDPFYGPARGFSFRREIQPILDKHCIKCHDGEKKNKKGEVTFSLLGKPIVDNRARRTWTESYVNLTLNGQVKIDGQGCVGRAINWLSPQSSPKMIPPYSAGSCKSQLMNMLEGGHGNAEISREEYEKIAAWIDVVVPFCGDYQEANTWNDDDWRKHAYFANRRRVQEEFEAANIRALVKGEESPSPTASPGGEKFAENVAFNPDAQHEGGPYPRVTASSECRDKPCYRGLNVINGRTENTGHGPKFPSWGPEREETPWINIDFGGTVETDKIVITLRAQFPHDGYWSDGVLEFSDGEPVPVQFKKTAEAQVITFPRRKTKYVKLRDLKWAQENTWCALTEFEVWGARVGL